MAEAAAPVNGVSSELISTQPTIHAGKAESVDGIQQGLQHTTLESVDEPQEPVSEERAEDEGDVNNAVYVVESMCMRCHDNV
jgi:hypothetical protein